MLTNQKQESVDNIKVNYNVNSLRRNLLLVLLPIFFTNLVRAQMKFSFYANPFVQRYGNMDQMSTEYGNSSLYVHYSKIPSTHFGFEVIFPTERKYNFVATLQHVSNRYKVDYVFFIPGTNTQIKSTKGQILLNTESLGFKIGLQRKLTSKIIIQADLGFTAVYKPKDQTLDGNGAETFGYYIDPNGNPVGGYTFRYKYWIGLGGFYPQLFIPEFSAHFRLVNNLYLRVGTQLKFFDFEKATGYIDVKVDGQDSYFEGVKPDEPLHFSRIKRTEFNYYLGLSYTFGGKKSK